MIESSARHTARELVKSIADEHGYLGERVYAKMDAETRRAVQKALLAKDKMIGSSIMVLARELYSKDVRFIFELLQNADDNHYDKAQAAKQQPSVAFHLYEHKVVIECNEDGFNEANLRAICSIGNSSKVGGHGYIGEKGIGFKSVFKVARRVLIQSGDFSFTFTHNPGDVGMGMISPEWEDSADESPDEGWTRITLYLHKDSEAATRYQDILRELKELDNTMLLFLKKLRRIDVAVYDEDDHEVSSTALFINFNETTHRAVLTKRNSEAGGDPETTNTYCHVTKHQATGLAKSVNRTYTAAEEAIKSYGKAEVILAFPLTSEDIPIVEAQQVFAFLPIRRLGFKFLIQTDFVTMANREDVVTSASRNLALLEGVAEAFIKATHEMYSHKTLRYQWMRYLAGMKEYPWDDFWRRLVDKITAKMAEAEILEPRRRGSPRRIRDLRRISHMSQDSNGDPLFEDLPGTSEMYISTGYEQADHVILADFGLHFLYHDEFVARVEYDLSLPNSRMKNPATTTDWHTRAAENLNLAWDMNWADQAAKTKALGLLPLSSGIWVSANVSDVYLPTLDSGIELPTNLGLNILAASECNESERLKLFKNLGARCADINDVRTKTLQRFGQSQYLYLSHEKPMLQFLYQTCSHQRGTFGQYNVVKIHNSQFECYSPRQVEYLFPNNDAFSPWQLSLRSQEESDPIMRITNFIDEDYLDDQPSKSGSLSWCEWLEVAIGVRRFPRLVSTNGKSLSELCKHVAEEIPESFLGFLRYAWESEKDSVLKNDAVLEELKSIKVTCNAEGGSTYALSKTYLPILGLQQKASSLLEGEDFPFLWLGGETLNDDNLGTWNFLKRDLTIGSQDDAQFYIDIVYYIKIAMMSRADIERPERMIDIYGRIHTRIRESTDQSSWEGKLRGRVYTDDLVYIPASGDDEANWVGRSECLLDAPRTLRHRYPIIARYRTAFPEVDLTLLTQFFQNSLAMTKYSWKDTIREIQHLQDEGHSEFDLINAQYEYLNRARRDWATTGINAETMREEFENHSLIFVQNENSQYRWVAPSECLWSSATEIQDRTSLNNYYDDSLEDFFVKFLNVSRLDVNMVYDELLRVDPQRTTVKQARDLLWQMNALLSEDENPKGTAENLLNNPILPVQYANGDIKLCSCENDFAIVDRRRRMELFQGKIKVLAFDHTEVHKLEPFLKWAQLGRRYLSKVVRESSVVDPASAFPLSDLSRDISQKARALTRVAVHIRSPRARGVQAFYDLLRSSKTLETDTISSELTISQDGAPISVTQQQSEVYIDENASPLAIYVPHDKDSLEVCFGCSLPEQLVTWMATNPVNNVPDTRVDDYIVTVVTGILATKSAVAINRILEKNGIIDATIPSLGPELECGVNADHGVSTPRGTGGLAQPPSPFALDREPSNPSPSTTVDDADAFTGISTPGSTWSRPPSPSAGYHGSSSTTTSTTTRPSTRTAHDRSASPPPRAAAPSATSGPYRRLLAHVVRAARATAALPSLDTASAVPDTSALLLSPGAGTEDDGGHMFAPSAGAWAVTDQEKKLIGAAGELFAFELLRRAIREGGQGQGQGQGLSREVWQTPIRALVAAGHAEYAGMAGWPREERADIVIEDDGGDGEAGEPGPAAVLLRLLVEGGYLGAEWAGRARAPRCYVEVKATMGPCETPFFMSDAQYRKMSELTNNESVYMIFRVFNMGKISIGVRIYLDPDQMRLKGRLRFTADRWTVTPVQGLLPHTARLLHQLGLYEEAKRRSYKLVSKCDRLKDGIILSDYDIWKQPEDGHGYPMLPLQRSKLIEVLWQSIPNRDKVIRTGAKVVKIEATDSNVHVHPADGKVETGSMVVGADGTHSMTRTYIREQTETLDASPSADIAEIPTVSHFYSIYGEGPNRHGIKSSIFYETRDTGMGIQLGTMVEMVRLILYKKLPKPLSTRVEYTRQEMEEFAESFFDMSGAPGVTIGDIWPDINKDSARLVSQEEGFAARWHTQRVVLTGDAAVTSSSVNGLGVNCDLHSTALLASEIQKAVAANANPDSASLEQAFARYQRFRAKELKRIYDVGYMSMRQMTWDSWTAWFIDRYAKRWISSDTLIKEFAHPMVRNGQILSYIPFEDVEAPIKWRWYPHAII